MRKWCVILLVLALLALAPGAAFAQGGSYFGRELAALSLNMIRMLERGQEVPEGLINASFRIYDRLLIDTFEGGTYRIAGEEVTINVDGDGLIVECSGGGVTFDDTGLSIDLENGGGDFYRPRQR